MKKYFPAGADKVTWIVTTILVAVALLLLALAGGIRSIPGPILITLYGLAGVIVLVLFIGWLAKPSRYEVRDDSVSVVRSWLFPRVVIRRSDIREIRSVSIRSPRPASLSIAGVFGYSGHFRNRELGIFLLFASRPADAVLIVAGEKYVISPANPKRFMHDLSGKK